MSKTNINQIEATNNQRRAFELVAEGKSFRQVADEMHISRSYAYQLFRKALDELKPDESKVTEWRILLSHRLDIMLQPLMAIIQNPESKADALAEAVRAAIRIEDRRARMLGIDKPAKIDVTHHIPALDPEEAAKRQRRRLQEEGFIKLNTRPPVALLPKVRDVEAEEVTDDDGNHSDQE